MSIISCSKIRKKVLKIQYLTYCFFFTFSQFAAIETPAKHARGDWPAIRHNFQNQAIFQKNIFVGESLNDRVYFSKIHLFTTFKPNIISQLYDHRIFFRHHRLVYTSIEKHLEDILQE